MKIFTCGMAVFMLAVLAGCSGKEQVYEGMYKGLGVAAQNRQTEDPSYDPINASIQKQFGYKEYKREREEILSKNNPDNNTDN